MVTGDLDGVVYTHIHSMGLVRDIPGPRLTTLEGIGHSPHYAAPDGIAELILEAERRGSARESASL